MNSQAQRVGGFEKGGCKAGGDITCMTHAGIIYGAHIGIIYGAIMGGNMHDLIMSQ